MNITAVSKGGNFEHPHTAFVHYSTLDVQNITLEPVSANQIESRNMLKAFTIAAAKAQSLYGVSIFMSNHDHSIKTEFNKIQANIDNFFFQ